MPRKSCPDRGTNRCPDPGLNFGAQIDAPVGAGSVTSDSQQEKKKIYLGHIILSRAAHAASEIRNRMNPLWNIADIPSGKSVTDMLRAIRFQLFKISQYKLAIEAMKKKVEYKNKLWDEDDKLEYIRTDVKERYEKFLAEFTFPDFWLAFLVCSYPVDHYLFATEEIPSFGCSSHG